MTMRHLAWAPLLWALAACGDVPSLQIDVEIRAIEVRHLGLLVVREGRASAVIDCMIDATGKQKGRCPFDEPQQTWMAADPLAFVLYGEPGARLDVRIEGFDAAGLVVTATRAIVLVPDTGRAQRTLILAAPTDVRARCELDITQDAVVQEPQKDRTGLLPVDVEGDGVLELVAATPRRIALLHWSRGEGARCVLTQTATIADDCTPRAGTLVAGELDLTRAGPEIAAICLQRNANTNRYRLQTWTLGPNGVTGASNNTLRYTVNQTTRAVVADLDGDGEGELSLLAVTSTTGPVVSVVTWRPSDARARETRIGGIRLASPTTTLPIAPVVVSSARGMEDALVLGGHRGGLYFLDSAGVHTVDANLGTAPAAFSGAVYERPGALPRALYARDAGGVTALVEAVVDTGVPPVLRPLADAQRTAGQANIAIAVGDLEGAGESSAVLAADGYVQIFSLTTTTAPARRFSVGESAGNAMVVLLADIDANPGAEILTFQPNVGRVFAFSGDGTPIVGFPIDLGVSGLYTRVVVADLDRDGAIELVALSTHHVNVVSLGSRTYHAAATPWPEAFHDASGAARLRDQRDPRL